ncbi:MAG: acylphosphatase [Patescibacteria group bacterium]
MEHVTLIVSGKVQGVSFRQSTRRVARELGLHGYAMNLNDGSVKIEAEGEEEAIQKLIKWARRGPWHARVENVIEERGELQHFKDFHIL